MLPLASLASLSILDLTGCRGVSDLSPLAGLASLSLLNLRFCTRVWNLKPLAGLASLCELNLWGCKGVSDLSPLAGLASLSILDLSDCTGVSDLSPLAGLASLSRLVLSECDWSAPFAPLRPLLSTLGELFLHLASFPDLPPALSGETSGENVLPAVRAYYADLDAGAVADAEAKVFLLGNGRVGKTQLARFLRGERYDPAEPSTHGVRLHDCPLDVPDLPHQIRLNLWDFGGQDVYHGSHALFLQRQAIFLLLWHPDLESGEYEEGGLTIRNRPLAYWFDYLRDFSGSRRADGRVIVESPVLLIQSKCESPGEERTPPLLPDREEFPNLHVLTFSARTRRKQASLIETLQEAVTVMFQRRKQPLIGVGRVAVRDRLREMQTAPEYERIRTISHDEFRQLCDEAGNVSDADALLQFLHRTGVVFHKPGLFGDRVIVDQSWALEAIYAVFHRRADLQAEFRARDGRFTRELLDRFVWGKCRREEGLQPFSREEQDLFLGMMVQCHVAFQARNLSGDRHNPTWVYAAPDLLPPWSRTHEARFRHLLRQPKAEVVLRYDFLHDGIARGFLAKLGTKAGPLAEYWKYGCWFHDADTDSEALVRCEPAPTPQRPGAGAISLRAWGTNANSLLRSLAQTLMQMPIGQPPRPDPLKSADTRLTDGFDDYRHRLERSDPLARLRPSHPPRTVFISYAHDSEPSDLVRRLVEVLRANRTTVIWDEVSLRDGESISEFVESVRTIPVLIPVFSARYPRSAYCVSELFAFFEACECRHDVFCRRVVPLVLADARIDSDLERVSHADFWAEQFEARRAAAGSARLDDERYRLHQRMLTWQGQIANVLAAVADRKFPRGSAALAADGFRAVLDRLEDAYEVGLDA